MPKQKRPNDLSRRERQIVDALYQLGQGSAAEIRELLPNPPSYTAVRTQLSILHAKELVRYHDDGTRYIYEPVVPREQMARSVIDHVLQTFFDNSLEKVVESLVDRDDAPASDEQLDRLALIIARARAEGR